MSERNGTFIQYLARSGGWVAGGLLLGRALGFLREAVIGARFGATSYADVVILTLTLPDLFINLLVGGALAAALIPELRGRDRSDALKIYSQSSGYILLLFFGIAMLASLSAPAIVRLLGPGLPEEFFELAVLCSRIAFWSLPFSALAGLTGAYLHSQERFGLASLGTAIFNIVLIMVMVGMVNDVSEVAVVAVAVVMASVVRWLAQAIAIPASFSFVSRKQSLLDQNVVKRFGEALFASGLFLTFPYVSRAFASLLGAGDLAVTNFAQKLVELPLGIGLSTIVVVMFPRFASGFAQAGERGHAVSWYRRGESLIWSLGAGLAVAGGISAVIVARLVYGHGVLGADALDEIARLTMVGMVGLPAQGALHLSISGLNAWKDTRPALALSGAGLLLLVLASWMGARIRGLEGIVAAQAVTYFIVSLFLSRVMERRHEMGSLLSARWMVMLGIPLITAVTIWFGQKLIATISADLAALAVSLLLGAAASGAVWIWIRPRNPAELP